MNNIASKVSTQQLNTIAKNTAMIGAPLLASAGLYAMSDENLVKDDDNIQVDEDSEMTFFEFLRSFRIAQIPIMDLIILYIAIYVANAFYFKCSYQLPLLVAIIMTIVLAIFFDREFKLSLIIIIILTISLYLLIFNNYCDKKIE